MTAPSKIQDEYSSIPNIQKRYRARLRAKHKCYSCAKPSEKYLLCEVCRTKVNARGVLRRKLRKQFDALSRKESGE